MDHIYLDYNATTPLAKEVTESIRRSLDDDWGNPSSTHAYGTKSKKAIIKARNQIARMLDVEPEEIIFTSGGTEANNMIIYGILQYFKQHPEYNAELNEKPHLITTNVEHDSVLLPIMQLRKLSVADCSIVEVDDKGMVNLNDILSHIKRNTCLVSIMYANNETGVIMPISAIGKKIKKINEERENKKLIKVLFHTDAAQIIGKEEVVAKELAVDYMTIVGHKFYGPRIGCIWARGPLFPLFYGGGQEFNIRPGTENTPMIVGLGTAAELVTSHVCKYKSHMMTCRIALETALKEAFGDGVVINCEEKARLSNTTNISFVGEGLEGKLILNNCKRLIAGVGAACHGGECSQILINSGVPFHLAKNAIRLSIGRDTTVGDVYAAVMDLKQAVEKVKKNR